MEKRSFKLEYSFEAGDVERHHFSLGEMMVISRYK